ncbi:hypothetical protein QFC19_003698 [Naganishia cerealis]|uniref:Uncharacterized protein n=1 Tax=Naganishia cerealis TaxID=610337 RepID=A0ACC2W114_9TREE|nr:hypothetical protein QFC19_003698 [Naganishia cerealis]
MSTPAAPPPQYTDSAPKPKPKTYGAAEDLHSDRHSLLGHDGPSSSRGNAWIDQPEEDDLPDDFKVGVNVADCDVQIRMGFYPANMILLGAFTIFESLMIGTVTSYYSARIVLQALIITTGVFVGLTLFTFQSKYDFSNMGPYLFAGLMGMLVTGLVQFFLPFNQTTDLIIACFGVLLFSGYTVYDTHAIMKRLSPDEYILGALSLYLDFINLFLYILRVLNNQDRD